MKLKIRSNFSFSKLAKEMPGILEKYSSASGKGSAKNIKTSLEKGSYQPLEESTKDIRRRGKSPNAGFMATSSTKPLIHTGSLRNSIRVDKEGIKMNKYGKFQNDGYIVKPSKRKNGFSNKFHTVGKTVPPRPFINKGMAMESPESKQAAKDLSKNIRKALKK